jgi:tetratricopeptide (TPR) repeat protein
MSFQGDVAGIGLGELLQGLARGERNGILTLTEKSVSATVGLRRGQMYLLPSTDEDEGLWRERCLRAYADDPNGNLEAARRASIARASRLETFYRMMEAPNLHFRFDPGQLPPAPSAALLSPDSAALGHRKVSLALGDEQEFAEEGEDSSWGTGMPVEYLLLEHARISDELRTGAGAQLLAFDLPRALDPERQAPEARDFLEQCNGTSTVQEIADRLAWPLSKCRGVLGEYLAAGLVRVAPARELLAAAQRELELGRAGRAALRLEGWLARGTSGPLSPADAQLLLAEWGKERLQKALAVAEPGVGRAILRRLDRLESDALKVHARWKALAALHKQDDLTLLHEVSLRLVSSQTNSRTFADLLRLAHAFHQRGRERRTRMLLRLCANHLPEEGPIRVELGRRMLDAGLMNEGSRWLLNIARELLQANEGDAAVLPLRAILRVAPEHEEARALLAQAQVVKQKVKRRRVGLSVGLSAGLTLALVALVKLHDYRRAERWAADASKYSPSDALARLDGEFGSNPPARIATLREELERSLAEEQRASFESWSKAYREAEEACRFGDPLLGFARALELPAAPHGSAAATPDTNDLLGQLARRLGDLAKELDVSAEAPLEALNEEERLLDLLAEFEELMKSRTLPPQAHSFQFRVSELRGEIEARRGSRAAERERNQAKERAKEQDILLATARAHDNAGDLERALTAYDRLIESDSTLAHIPELQVEIERVRQHHGAFRDALELCTQGRHAEAEGLLRPLCPRPIEHLMPYRVESLPSGARVTFPDGHVRTTPFTGKSGFGEETSLTFSLPGYQDRVLRLTDPADLLVCLSFFPERWWKSAHKVEAAPVPSGDDHVVADRRGRMARLDQHSRSKWELELKTLGGIARTPVFLPNKSGWLFVVSEDGQVWLVQASSGNIEGPRDIGSPPVAGPDLTRGGVSVQFADGRVGLWTDALEPVFYEAEAPIARSLDKDSLITPSIELLRRSAGASPSLSSPWNGWTVTVHEREYRVRASDGRGFSAEREGEWVFVAWEKPKVLVPHGRLWVSDAGGLRAYAPDPARMVPFPDEE